MKQLDLMLENIRLGHIEKLLQEAQTKEEINRGVALINESMSLIEESLSDLTDKTLGWANKNLRGCTAENGYKEPGNCNSYDRSRDEYFTGPKKVNDGEGNYKSVDNSYHNQNTEY
jgi:hypothetical protein